jgi:hypothetical protein
MLLFIRRNKRRSPQVLRLQILDTLLSRLGRIHNNIIQSSATRRYCDVILFIDTAQVSLKTINRIKTILNISIIKPTNLPNIPGNKPLRFSVMSDFKRTPLNLFALIDILHSSN